MFFFVVALGFFLGNENYSLIETEGNKNLCVLTSCQLLNTRCFHHQLVGFAVVSEKPAPGFTAF